MAATSSRMSRKQRGRISQPASPRMALNTQLRNLTPTSSRSASKMARSIFIIQTASTWTCYGGTLEDAFYLSTTSKIQTITTTATLSIAPKIRIGLRLHHIPITASKSTPSFLPGMNRCSHLTSQCLQRGKWSLLDPCSHLPQPLIQTAIPPTSC